MHLKQFPKELLLAAARGDIQSDLVITNIQLVNVITGEIYPADVFIKAGFISHIETKNPGQELHLADKILDGQGQYLTPSLIDAHVHIESSMLTPQNFAETVIPWGTTTVITDPHEIANVFGEVGVKYMHDAALDYPMRQLINIPSCVPSVSGLENAGASFDQTTIKRLSTLPRVVGLAEVMDFIGLINGDKRMLEIIETAAAAGLYIQGHAPAVSGRALSAYAIGGPKTDHESRTSAEGIEKLRVGLYVDARESSISKNVQAVWDGVKHVRHLDQLCLCTDDCESEDILSKGHMNEVVRQAIKAGMHPLDALRSATYNSAKGANLEKLGAIAPGYLADLLLIPDLATMMPSTVIFEGELVAQNQKLLKTYPKQSFELEKQNSLVVKPLTLTDLMIKAPIENGEILCNVMTYQTLEISLTRLETISLPVKDYQIQLDKHPDIKFVAVINRYPDNDNIALHVVKNFGLTKGALASTVSHDAHNLTVVYDTPANALIAVNELIKCGGGMSAVLAGKVLNTLPLPVAGLISDLSAPKVALNARKMKQANRKLGLTALKNPLLRIVTLALPVIPGYKMSDLGLVDVLKHELVPLFKTN